MHETITKLRPRIPVASRSETRTYAVCRESAERDTVLRHCSPGQPSLRVTKNQRSCPENHDANRTRGNCRVSSPEFPPHQVSSPVAVAGHPPPSKAPCTGRQLNMRANLRQAANPASFSPAHHLRISLTPIARSIGIQFAVRECLRFGESA